MEQRSDRFFDIDRPRNVSRVIPLYSVRAGERLTRVIVSPRVYGRVTHFIDGRTQPCRALEGECACLTRPTPTRDRGYLLTAHTTGALVGFIDLTPLAFEQMEVIREERGTLRGLIVLMMRQGKTSTSRLLIERIGDYSHATPLPDDRSPDPTLARVWGVKL